MHVSISLYNVHTFLLQLFYIGIIDEAWQVYISSVNTVVKQVFLLQCLHSSPYPLLIVYPSYCTTDGSGTHIWELHTLIVMNS